jgi:hypothetical protein
VRFWTQDSFDQKYKTNYLNEKCLNATINHNENVLITNYNCMYLRFHLISGDKFKYLGKVNIPENEINCFGLIFNNQGLLATTLQDRIFILDVQNWDALSILYTEVDTASLSLPQNQYYKYIDTKNINASKTLASLSFSDGSTIVLSIEKENGKIVTNKIDKYNMFEHHISKSDDPNIPELYRSLTSIRVFILYIDQLHV